MKKILLIIAVLTTMNFGQVSADLTIENQEVVGTDFLFDIYLTRTESNDIYLGTGDLVLTFNSSAFTNPVITRESSTYWNLTSTSGFPVGILYRATTSPASITSNELIINLNQVPFGDQQEFDDNIAKIDNTPLTHRIGRYKVSGISNPSEYMNLQWKTIGTGITTQVFTLSPVSPWTSSPVNINAINPPNAPLSTAPTTFQLSVSVTDGWNMVSIPGLHPVNQEVNTWWSGKDPSADVFKYIGGYQPVSTVAPGIGYWMKHSGANTYSTGDEWPAEGINIVPHDPLSATAGWNLIGGYEYDAAVSGITTTPPGLLDSPVYGYSGGYQIVNFLIPGYGYWVKLSGTGLINIPDPVAKGIIKTKNYIKDGWGKIIISDASGKSFTLYATDGNVDLTKYELPPLPPEGVFDIRFGSGRFAENLNNAFQSIEMRGIEYPVVVYVENIDIRLKDKTGNIINSQLQSGEKITLNNSINKLLVSTDVLPDDYSLEQNYPNPFNPSTTIEFSTPELTNVTLTIYNALGQKVAVLVNSELEAGLYSYAWNADNAATGLYIYELRTEKFISVKKMILMK